MTLEQALTTLENLGTAQNRKVYACHGAGDNQFGVSFENLKKLKKQIRTDHNLARELWNTGNADARVLATMIADPNAVTPDELETWAASITYYALADLLAAFVAKTPLAAEKMAHWMESDAEYTAQAGWTLLAHAAAGSPDLPDAWFEGRLAVIEQRIHTAKNRVRHAMNAALIAIALRNEHLKTLAIDAARRIGKVTVDHGETACKTPDAIEYIRKAEAWAAKRKSRA